MKRPKDKGTRAETAVVRYARDNGFPWADRQPPRGAHDAGDVALCPGVIIEVKAVEIATGLPPALYLHRWMAETEAERLEARAHVGILVVKRKGTTDAARWLAYLPLWAITELVADDVTLWVDSPEWLRDAPVMLPFQHLLALLRRAGYGQPLEDEPVRRVCSCTSDQECTHDPEGGDA